MHKIILFGATAAVLSLGASGAYAIGGGNISPEQSPYAILSPQTLGPSWTGEGRAADTEHGYYGSAPAYGAPATDIQNAPRHRRHQY